MKELDYIQLKRALSMAKQHALNFSNVEDGGTCNFDSPYICLSGTSEKSLNKWFGDEFGVYKYFNGCYIIGYKVMKGQANRHTKMAEVFAETLKQYGYDSGVHYVMD